jgi:predicted TIM-barrel fold metal-dependent hydrolase
MFVHPLLDSVGYLRTELSAFAGAKLKCNVPSMSYSYSDLRNNDVMEHLARAGIPVVFHTGVQEGARASDVLWFVEKTRGVVVLAHSARLREADLKQLEGHGNVFIDVSPLATMVACDLFVERAMRPTPYATVTVGGVLDYLYKAFGGERVLWGSDSPYCDNMLKCGFEEELEVLSMMIEKDMHSKGNALG